MKVQEITKDHILFDNGKKLTYLFFFPEETRAYLYFVDFFALAPQLEGKELDDEVRIYRPSRMVRSKEFDDAWEMTAGVILQFGIANSRARYYLPLYKKANPEYKPLDIEKVYWALDCTPEQKNQPGFDWEAYEQTLAQLEQWKKDEKRIPDSDFWNDTGMILAYDDEPLDISLGRLNLDEFMYLPCQYAHAEEPVYYDPKRAMKIVLVTDQAITFSNGKKITFDHMQHCCEYNYADFEQIDDVGRNAVYYENELIFEAVEGVGFRFGNRGGAMTFIPCYSVQNGYYTKEIDIFYGGRSVLHVENEGCYEPEIRIIWPGEK